MATNAELEEQLKEAKKLIVAMDEKLSQLLDPPRAIGTVLGPAKDIPGFITVLQGGNILVLKAPPEYQPVVGDQALLSNVTKGMDRVIAQPQPGKTSIFKRYLDDVLCEVESQQGLNETRIIYYDNRFPYEEGDIVLLDASSNIILRNLGKPILKGYKPSEDFKVTWDDVGGLDEVREFFQEVFEAPINHPEIYSHYNMRPPKGVLMTGPPGCGKSLIAKAVANSVTSRWEGDLTGGFISVKGPEILSPYVGMAEMKIRELFDNCRQFFKRTGFPAVLFVDEAESVMNKRGSGRSSDVDRTIVPAFLAEMDGLDISGAIVILATNRPEMLDSAITREGRIDKKIRIPRPAKEAGRRIFHIHLRDVPLAKSLTREEMADFAAECFYSERHALYTVTRKSDKPAVRFGLANLASGAMIATICQQASQVAMSRDIKHGRATGVNTTDIEITITSMLKQQVMMDHKEELASFVEPWRDDVAKILKYEPEEVL